MSWQLTLRAHLPPGDRDLALAEVRHLCDGVEETGEATLTAASLRVPVAEAARRFAFVQSLAGPRPTDLAPAAWWVPQGDGLCAVPRLALGELLTLASEAPSVDSVRGWAATLATGEATAVQRKALARKQTSTPHVHGLHTYKAKFFPRMVRSRLHVALDRAPVGPDGQRVVLDPFSGSGTTAWEAAALGHPAVGVDIDPLSVSIARAKRALGRCDGPALAAAVERCLGDPAPSPRPYSLPPWMAKKWDRKGLQAERAVVERDIATWRDTLLSEPDRGVRAVLAACLSDALVRKFHVRMMGTGVGRFALEVRQRSLGSFVRSALERAVKARAVLGALDEAWPLSCGAMQLVRGTATALDVPDASVSVVLTSPPYLPASSGREAYLIGKSISLTALGLMSAAEIAGAETGSVGSMKAAAGDEGDTLPAAVHTLVDWLQGDDLRRIKAAPTLRYHRDLLRALRETRRVLVPGGEAIWVVGKQSTFYRFKTREVLHQVHCDAIFRELAALADLAVVDQTDVRLDKQNRNARPRSLDDYYESVITLRRPQ